MIKTAKNFALMAHTNQRYGKYPYQKHLEDVFNTLKRFNIKDGNILVAAWLHDTIEDTKVTYELLEKTFNQEIADLVHAVSNEKSDIETYLKMKKNKKAVILKLADRIANVECCLQDNHVLLKKYSDGYAEFKKHLKDEDNDMWNHLENLL